MNSLVPLFWLCLKGGDFHAIAARAFCGVERFVRPAQKLRKFCNFPALEPGDSKAGSDAGRIVSKAKHERSKLFAKAVHSRKNALVIHVSQHHHELFSAHTAANI